MKLLVPNSIRCRIADIRGRGVYSGYPNEHRCIFIHIPKAAGTSVTRTLFGCDSRHVRYTEYENANPRKFHEYFKFSFVRNPWSRFHSAYSFLKQGGMNEMDRQWAEENLCRYPDFDSFVKGWVNPENIRSYVHFYPQHYFICDDQLNLKMDFVGRFETLDRDIAYVQEQLGLPVKPLPRINSSSQPNAYLGHYNEETKRIVESVYTMDIDLFSYNIEHQVSEFAKESRK